MLLPFASMPLLLLAACIRHGSDDSTPTAPSGWAAPEGLVLASDLRGNEWFIADPMTGETVDALRLDTLEADVCAGEENEQYCLLFQSRTHTSNVDSASPVEEVLFTYSALDVSDGDDDSRTDLISRIYSVDRATHETRWHYDQIDFSQLANGADYCTWDPADPCRPDPGVDTKGYWACSVHMVHDMIVTHEDANTVAMWVVDSRNSRMLHVSLDREATCATVDTVLDLRVDDWDIYNSVNSLEIWTDGDTDTLLMSIKGSFADAQTGEQQMGGGGRGKIVLWRRDAVSNGGAAPWTQAWEFPPESTTEESFLNDPHGVSRTTDADGRMVVTFAHSLGHSPESEYGKGTGGSIGVLRVQDDLPVYLYDAMLPRPDVLQFPRDVTPLPDGTFLLTDSGCLGDGCAYETYDWVVSLPEADPVEGKTGAWRADHSEQVYVDAEVLHGPMFPNANLLYSSEWVSR
ncbi:MAG: hypothetical protein EXR69_02495 [Myxococcales bacterium]|nr:hypothetical protein [Myxococcales bacterium]